MHTSILDKQVIDLISMTAVIGVFADFLPTIAAFFTVVWMLIRIFEWVRFRLFNKKDKNDQYF